MESLVDASGEVGRANHRDVTALTPIVRPLATKMYRKNSPVYDS